MSEREESELEKARGSIGVDVAGGFAIGVLLQLAGTTLIVQVADRWTSFNPAAAAAVGQLAYMLPAMFWAHRLNRPEFAYGLGIVAAVMFIGCSICAGLLLSLIHI